MTEKQAKELMLKQAMIGVSLSVFLAGVSCVVQI